MAQTSCNGIEQGLHRALLDGLLGLLLTQFHDCEELEQEGSPAQTCMSRSPESPIWLSEGICLRLCRDAYDELRYIPQLSHIGLSGSLLQRRGFHIGILCTTVAKPASSFFPTKVRTKQTVKLRPDAISCWKQCGIYGPSTSIRTT